MGRTVSFKHDMNSVKRPEDPTSGGPVRVAFLAAGFNFAAGRRVLDVPYDPRTPFLFDVRHFPPSLPRSIPPFRPSAILDALCFGRSFLSTFVPVVDRTHF